MTAPRTDHGFTVIEMMFTVMIVVILIVVAIPGFRTLMQNAQVRTAAESIQAGMQFARAEALRRNTRVTYWPVNNLTGGCGLNASGTSWVVSVLNPAGACNEAYEVPNAEPANFTAHRIFQTRSGNEGSPNVSVVADSNCLTFNGFGRVEATCSGGGAPITTVAITSSAPNTLSLGLRITAGGSIRMCNTAVQDTTDPSKC